MVKLELLKFVVELYPCPPFNGKRVVIYHIKESDNSVDYEMWYINDEVGGNRYLLAQHIRKWINILCLFINFKSYLIDLYND